MTEPLFVQLAWDHDIQFLWSVIWFKSVLEALHNGINDKEKGCSSARDQEHASCLGPEYCVHQGNGGLYISQMLRQTYRVVFLTGPILKFL